MKINFYLKKFKKYFFGRKILIAKELTKIHEAFLRDNINDILPFKNKLKGELTIVISDIDIQKKPFDEKIIVNKIKKYLKRYSLKDTVDLISEAESINKKEIYKICLRVKNEKNF